MGIMARMRKTVTGLISARAAEMGGAWLADGPADERNAMAAKKKLWRQIYKNEAPWLRPGRIHSANLAAIAVGDVARLVTMDLKARVVGDERIAKTFTREAMWDIRNHVEYGLALGGFVMKPYAWGDDVRVALVLPREYEILEVDTDGTIADIKFFDHETGQEKVRVERHVFDGVAGICAITNEVFEKGRPLKDAAAALKAVPRWANILPAQEIAGCEAPLFGFFRPATSNTVDMGGIHGVSFFDKAIPTIKLADEHLSALVREFRLKEARLYVDRDAIDMTVRGGGRLPHLEEDLYVKMDVDAGSGNGKVFFEVFSPDIRSAEYLSTFNKYQQLVEDCLGLMHGTFSMPDTTDRTATAVRESKHRTYATVLSNQHALRQCLEEVMHAMAKYLGKDPGALELALAFDDSLVRDPQETLRDMLADVSMGLVRPELYLAKKYGVTEEDAKAMMPKGTQLLRDGRTALTWNEAELTADVRNDGGTE